jgi:hypothetical protein
LIVLPLICIVAWLSLNCIKFNKFVLIHVYIYFKFMFNIYNHRAHFKKRVDRIKSTLKFNFWSVRYPICWTNSVWIDHQYPLACRKRRLNNQGSVSRHVWHDKDPSLCHGRCGTIKIPPCVTNRCGDKDPSLCHEQVWHDKNSSLCHSRCGTMTIPPYSRDLRAGYRYHFCCPSPSMVTSLCGWKNSKVGH